MAAEDAEPRLSHFSTALERGLLVIRAFDVDAPLLSVSDVARRTNMPRAAARRFLLTLQDLGYVGTAEHRFYLRPSVLELGFSYLSSVNVDRIVQPVLNEISDQTHETSSFSVLNGFDVLLVARAASKRFLSLSVGIGGRIPAFETSLGLVLLSGVGDTALEDCLKAQQNSIKKTKPAEIRSLLKKIRNQGWAAKDHSSIDGTAAIAVPVLDRSGTIIAALNIIQYPARDSETALKKKYLSILQSGAKQLEAALGASGQSRMMRGG